MIDPWLLLGAFIFLAYTVEAVTGFGSIVIALSLGALFLPIPELMPVLVPLSILQSGYLTWRYRQHIHLPTLFGLILPFMALGTGAGYLLRPAVEGSVLKILFGLLIIWFAGYQLWQMWRGALDSARNPFVTKLLLLASGITHGLFASGGPLLVFALAGTKLDKTKLRTTLIAVWFSLNGMLTVIFLFDGSLLSSLPRLAAYLPVVLTSLMAGEWLHRRIHEQHFRQLVYFLLVITGVLLALPR